MTKTTLSAGPPTDGDQISTALSAVYNWNYNSEIDELRNLYAKGLDLQWIAMKELPWDKGVDKEAFARTFTMGGIPIQETKFWASLAPETRWEVARRGAALMLSNFLHGEQGALMVASQLVNAVPHMDGKFYAATQTLDEARHVEVFARYIEELDHIHAIAPSLKDLLDDTLKAEKWTMKCVGMQIVVEGLALYSFRDMRDTTEDVLLKSLLTYVSRDEARHTAYGIKYLSAVMPTLTDVERAELEDFAFESARKLIDSRAGLTFSDTLMEMWKDVGVDPADVFKGIAEERDTIRAALVKRGGRLGPISGFVIPTLKNINLFSDRIGSHFRDMFDAMNIALPEDESGVRKNPMDALVELPEDLEAWVMEGAP